MVAVVLSARSATFDRENWGPIFHNAHPSAKLHISRRWQTRKNSTNLSTDNS